MALSDGFHPPLGPRPIENRSNERLREMRVVGYIHQPDLGEPLEIPPERAKLVNDTIWEVVTGHPHTGFKDDR